MHNSTDEPINRRTLREVVALSALPSIWEGYAPHQVAESLAEVLVSTLQLSFVYVHLHNEIGGEATEVARINRFPATERQASAIAQSLAPWLNNADNTLQHSVPNPVGQGTVRLLRAPLGRDGGEGVVVAGSTDATFPSEDDRVRLSVGGNQAGIVLQHWRAKEQLQESQALWEDAERLANVGSWSWSIASNKVFWSDEHYRIYGLEPQSVPATYERCLASIHPADRARVEGKIEQAQHDHQPFECVFQLVRPDGDIRVAKALARVVLDRNDVPVRMIGTVQDITEQHHAEQMIRHSEERFRAICDQAVVGIAQIDLNGRFLFLNDSYVQSLGYTRAELLQMRIQDVTHPDDLVSNLIQFRALGEGGPDYRIEKRRIRKDGSVLWVRNHVNAIRDPSGNVTSSVAVSMDITDQRQQEEALRASEVRYRTFVDHADNSMFLHDAAGRILDVNRHACESLGYSRDELIGNTPAIFDPNAPEIIAERTSQLDRGESLTFDSRHSRKDGSTFPVAVRVRPFEVDGQRYAISLAYDITERMQTEEDLRSYAAQLRDLSVRAIDMQENERRHLARELHDEIGQILNAISVNLHALTVDCENASKPRLAESISIVDRAIHQVHDLSLDLRPSMLDDLGLVSTIRWFAGRQAQRASLQLEFVADSSGERLPADLEIACYRVVQEALTNVVRHAQARNVCVEFRQREADVQLVIRDDGVGFDLDAVHQSTSRGASFGVLGMKERVDILGGQIEFKSQPGHGTSLHVHFPLAAQPTSPVEPQARQRR